MSDRQAARAARANAKTPKGLGDTRPQASGGHGRAAKARPAREEVGSCGSTEHPAPCVESHAEARRQASPQAGTTGAADGEGRALEAVRRSACEPDRQRYRRLASALDRPVHGLVQEVAEHRRLGLAAVVAPRPLVQVALKPLVRDGVVRSAHAGLEQAKEPPRSSATRRTRRGLERFRPENGLQKARPKFRTRLFEVFVVGPPVIPTLMSAHSFNEFVTCLKCVAVVAGAHVLLFRVHDGTFWALERATVPAASRRGEARRRRPSRGWARH
jgi:hypothetical protein